MKKSMFPALLIIILLAGACKDKTTVTPVKTSEPLVVERAPVPPPVPQEEEVIQPEPVEPDRYFLIAGSFIKQDNAEVLKNQWRQKGYDTEIVTRSWGVNSDFYRVAYMGFPKLNQAIDAMKQERTQEGKENVWVLVKK